MYGSFDPKPFQYEEEEEEHDEAQPMDQEEDPVNWLEGMQKPNDSMIEINGDKRRFTHIPKSIPEIIPAALIILTSDEEANCKFQETAALHMCLPIWMSVSPIILFFRKEWMLHGRGFFQNFCQLQEIRSLAMLNLHKSVDIKHLIASYRASLKALDDEHNKRLDAIYQAKLPNSLEIFSAFCSQYALDLIHIEERFVYELLFAPYEDAPPYECMLSSLLEHHVPQTPAEYESFCQQSYIFFKRKAERVAKVGFHKTIRYDLIKTEWLPRDVLIDYFNFGNEEEECP